MFTITQGRNTMGNAATLKGCSDLYAAERDQSGEGASTFGIGRVVGAGGAVVGYISYNAKIWDRDPAKLKGGETGELLFDPYA